MELKPIFASMSEEIHISENAGRTEKYKELIPQLESLIAAESDWVANVSNVMAVLKTVFPWLWVGLYRVSGDELILGPFQGPLACTRIARGKGVCGASWDQKRTLIVPDVEAFPGHIACSSLSRSEIVVPVFYREEVIAVLDVDSAELDAFNEEDALYLGQIAELLSNCLSK